MCEKERERASECIYFVWLGKQVIDRLCEEVSATSIFAVEQQHQQQQQRQPLQQQQHRQQHQQQQQQQQRQQQQQENQQIRI